jgi:hypothetical protein
MRRKVLLMLVTGALTLGMSAYAHHSFTATYDESATVQIEGTLVQFLFRNPHSWVHIMAPDENGDMQRWGVEWGGLGVLAGQGVTRESLKPGDHVIISGNPGRNPQDHRIRMRSLLRPADGFGWGFEGEDFD